VGAFEESPHTPNLFVIFFEIEGRQRLLKNRAKALSNLAHNDRFPFLLKSFLLQTFSRKSLGKLR